MLKQICGSAQGGGKWLARPGKAAALHVMHGDADGMAIYGVETEWASPNIG
jgi:hypothetical protein